MKRHTLILPELHFERVSAYLAAQGEKEGAGYLWCGASVIASDPWDGGSTTKYLVREFRPVPAADIVSTLRSHVTWKTDSFVHALRGAQQNQETVVLVHGHPNGLDCFSGQDDRNEADLITTAQKRNGPSAHLISIVVLLDGRLFGRIWKTPSHCEPLDLIVVAGRRHALHYPGRGAGQDRHFLNRQALALGLWWCKQRRTICVRSKADGSFWGWEMEEKDGELSVDGSVEEDGDIAVGMKAAGDGGAAGPLAAQALGANGDAPIGAHFGLGSLAPDIGPPRAVWGRAQRGALFLERKVPGGLRGGAQFAVDFFLVVVEAEFFEQGIGLGEGGDVLGGEERRQALLPEVVGALDLGSPAHQPPYSLPPPRPLACGVGA